jgi:hypothetical protein
MYYGEDFIEKSVMSIINDIDKIFIMYTDRPWSGIEKVTYKGEIMSIPCPVDKAVHIAKNLEAQFPGKVYAFYHYHPVPDNQFTVLFDSLKLRGLTGCCNVVMLMEPDMVWPEGKLKPLLNTLQNIEFPPLCTYQIEFWKSDGYMIPVRERPGAIFHGVLSEQEMPETEKNGSTPNMKFIDEIIYNYGFCMSQVNMFWKHLICMNVAKNIHDSIVDESWYEEKWLKWDFMTNNSNLEPSKNYSTYIPYALLYDRTNKEIDYLQGKRYIHIDRS